MLTFFNVITLSPESTNLWLFWGDWRRKHGTSANGTSGNNKTSGLHYQFSSNKRQKTFRSVTCESFIETGTHIHTYTPTHIYTYIHNYIHTNKQTNKQISNTQIEVTERLMCLLLHSSRNKASANSKISIIKAVNEAKQQQTTLVGKVSFVSLFSGFLLHSFV